MNDSKAQNKVERKRRLVNRKRRIQYRLRDIHWTPQDELMFRANNIQYELADRIRRLGPGRNAGSYGSAKGARQRSRTDLHQ